MTQEVNYSETTCDKILRFLKDWDENGRFKKFYYGDPGEIPTNSQPCVIVDLVDTNVVQGPTATDEVVEIIDVILVLNKKTYMDDFEDDTVSYKKQLEIMVQGNDPTSLQYDTSTILGILRTNFTLGNYATNQELSIRYREVPRNGIDEDPTTEAHVRATIHHFQGTPAKV